MPRRVVGSANYGLYASLTKNNDAVFLNLLASIIYDTVTDELSGLLKASGILTRKERQGEYQLTAKIWLTDTVIAIQAIAFTGPDADDDDDDERNDPHEICQFEFERDRSHWRLSQVSGAPLPTPDNVNRASASDAEPRSSIKITSASITARFTAHVGSSLRSMIAATASYLNRSRPHAASSMRCADRYFPIFINYSRKTQDNRWAREHYNSLIGSSFDNRPHEIQLAYRIAVAILRANDIIGAARTQITEATLLRTVRAVLVLFGKNSPLLSALAEREPVPGTIRQAVFEAFSSSPVKARRLLRNLLEIGAEDVANKVLRKTNRAHWNSLVVRPLKSICTETYKWKTPEKANSKSLKTSMNVVPERTRQIENPPLGSNLPPDVRSPRRTPRRPGFFR